MNIWCSARLSIGRWYSSWETVNPWCASRHHMHSHPGHLYQHMYFKASRLVKLCDSFHCLLSPLMWSQLVMGQPALVPFMIEDGNYIDFTFVDYRNLLGQVVTWEAGKNSNTERAEEQNWTRDRAETSLWSFWETATLSSSEALTYFTI